ncbi:MAG: carbohydrate kinase [Chloroflexi bacterium]|nr:carbohydrate kinase [Chloroflexota bacterium]MCI0644844.1 carbohydrate kinase [Chloroflexota bacterium]MCI0731430.1 carbohydrate kinase [Chloroflexota bacterium]
MALLGVDIGTTHCKVGLFAEDGTALHITSRPTQARQAATGYAYYDPEALWETVATLIQEVTTAAGAGTVAAVGIASMAETGLLLDRQSGAPRSALIPWFDAGATAQAAQLGRQADLQERFCQRGIYPSFKCSLAKVLWLREQHQAVTNGAVWLSAADYVAYRLTGVMATDYSLAGRTYAFDLNEKKWDEDWLVHLGLEPGLFPTAVPSGTPLGKGVAGETGWSGLARGTAVSITGHDHVCAALAAGVLEPGQVFDSMGTAEAFMGALPERKLGEAEFRSGLSYGCHVTRGRAYWMGGLSASGGSIEWLRSLLGQPPLLYEELKALLSELSDGPGDILYFPYLLGSGSPHTDIGARGAFVGLSASHGRADLLKAVLEGTAYEMEAIRRAAEQATGTKIGRIMAVGGGTRNRPWLQIKADVTGCPFELPAMSEATLLGAALGAGIGSGVYAGELEAVAAVVRPAAETIWPDAGRHAIYQRLYEQGYLALQEPLRQYYQRALH